MQTTGTESITSLLGILGIGLMLKLFVKLLSEKEENLWVDFYIGQAVARLYDSQKSYVPIGGVLVTVLLL